MDVVFDFLIEVLLDNLINITLSVIPENKRNEKNRKGFGGRYCCSDCSVFNSVCSRYLLPRRNRRQKYMG